MKLLHAVPSHTRLVRTYGGDYTIAAIEYDAQLLVDAGLTPHIVVDPAGANGYALFRDETADEQLVEIARENHPRRVDVEAAVQREIDDALEPHDYTSTRRDRAPRIPAEAPHALGDVAPRVRE
ncbi:MAG: hypothetical protein ACJ768_02640 [Gaiellaceae bacterium]